MDMFNFISVQRKLEYLSLLHILNKGINFIILFQILVNL